ncbi:response regulator [Xanthomarina spongicola]|uniref:DNA-binding NarL/FixJ family response regulator n=1 Tax=Xanthomarina spongicola TaxID=570520 RepID=A0A316DLW9_9FLAO|nr:response regulator transcription factor [Xanthomarina spongicola]PWK18578.1 DNA-binding NarL/FixJ family response regulator [Xanthomarina spongicola]
MFKKVLVSDDLVSINLGMLTILDSLNVKDVASVQYCDDAYLKIKRAAFDDVPFDLLITDLSFKKDHRDQTYQNGEDLIIALNNEFPDLKVIVYSIEDRIQKVKRLINNYQVKAYVCKGRRGLVELAEAIKSVNNNQLYVSHVVSQALHKKSDLEIDDYDIFLIKQLSNGLTQDQISTYFKSENISPSSLSSIEKNLNRLRIQFKANNAIHLVAIVKDLGLI